MKFVRKKLPLAEGHSLLRPVPVEAVEPFTLMFAPVYVPLQINGKFVAVKGPLDFFSPAEIERFKKHPQLFFHQSLDDLEALRTGAQRLKAFLLKAEESDDTETLGKAPYEVSEEILKIVGPLLGPQMTLEPFFIAFIANEILSPLPGELLMKGRELNIEKLELGVLRGSVCVLLALFLGIYDLEWLSGLRQTVAEEILGLREEPIGIDEFRELRNLAERWIPESDAEGISFSKVDFSEGGRGGRKIEKRLARVKSEMAKFSIDPPSMKGPKGFLSV